MPPRLSRTLAVPALMLAAALSSAVARADRLVGETVYYYDPVSYIVPTTYTTSSYVVPTTYTSSYVVPTSYSYLTPTSYSYLAPTSYTYLPTSYVTPTAYVAPTRYYYRTGLFGRRLNYVDVAPTAYYVPTVLSSSVVATAATSGLCCETGALSAAVVAPRAGSIAPPAGNGSGSLVKESTPTGGSKGNGEPGLNRNTAQPGAGASGVNPAGADAGAADSPPPAKPAPDPADQLVAPPADAGAAPKEDGLGGLQRDVRMRPAFGSKGDLNLRPQARPAGLLAGRVLSGGDRRPEANVKVTFTSDGGPFKPRTFTTDDQGRFDVPALPDGDWTVAVEDAQGKNQPYETLTVSRGRVTDADGRAWSTLTLNR